MKTTHLTRHGFTLLLMLMSWTAMSAQSWGNDHGIVGGSISATIEPSTLRIGETATLSIDVSNDVELGRVGCHISKLPEGLEWTEDSSSGLEPDGEGGYYITWYYEGMVQLQPGGHSRAEFTLVATQKTENALVSANAYGQNYEFEYDDEGQITSEEKVYYDLGSAAANVTVSSMLGDANGDGAVSIVDATTVANHVMGRTVQSIDEHAADANNDGRLSIADASKVVELLLTDPSYSPALAAPQTTTSQQKINR